MRIMMLASVREEEITLKAVQKGADEDITKPVDVEYLNRRSFWSNAFNPSAESFSGLPRLSGKVDKPPDRIRMFMVTILTGNSPACAPGVPASVSVKVSRSGRLPLHYVVQMGEPENGL